MNAIKVDKNSFQNGLPGVFYAVGKHAGLSDNLIKKLEGKHDNFVPKKPAKATPPSLTTEEKNKIAFYDDLNKYFGGDATNDKVPSDLKSQWEDLKKWPTKFPDPKDKTKTLTLEQVYTKYSEPKEPADLPTDWFLQFEPLKAGETKRKPKALKPTDYDTIKTERDTWITAFPKKDFEDKKPVSITPTMIKVDYDIAQEWLSSFPKSDFQDKKPTPITPAMVKVEYDKPKGTTGITPEQQKKIDNYDTLKTERDKLKGQLTSKQAEIDRLKSGGRQEVKKDRLADEINKAIIQAYNSEGYLIGYNEKLMRTFLSWEFSQDEKKRQTIIKLKSDINKCLAYLENKSRS